MFRLITAGPVGGDETRLYIVDFGHEYTVEHFIHEVLLNNREWGKISIHNRDYSDHIFGYPNCRYEYGELVSHLPDEYLTRKIKSAKADGGWSMMNYCLVLEE